MKRPTKKPQELREYCNAFDDVVEWTPAKLLELAELARRQQKSGNDEYLRTQFKRDQYHIFRRLHNNLSNRMTGRELYETLAASHRSNRGASLLLLDLGIDGIRYPSGSLSGVKDSDSFNYVVFDEDAISIDEVEDY